MAFEIKEISKFSVDSIDMAYEQLLQGEKEHMKPLRKHAYSNILKS